MTEETQENNVATGKEPKPRKLVLPKEARLMMVNFLESEHVQSADAMDDETVLKTYNEYAINASQKVKRLEATNETKSLNMYIGATSRLRLTDHGFIARLFNLSIPHFYLHLFKDDDASLTDKQLWAIVNKSGISPVDETAKLTKMKRSPIREKLMQA